VSWKESCAPLDQVPGLIVRGDGSGLIGGRGYVDHGDGTLVTWEDPFVIWQEPDGRYVAKMGLPRYGQVGKESPPGTIDEAVAFVVKEYEDNPMKPDPAVKTIPLDELNPSGTATRSSQRQDMILISAFYNGNLLIAWEAPMVPRVRDQLFVEAQTYHVTTVTWRIGGKRVKFVQGVDLVVHGGPMVDNSDL